MPTFNDSSLRHQDVTLRHKSTLLANNDVVLTHKEGGSLPPDLVFHAPLTANLTDIIGGSTPTFTRASATSTYVVSGVVTAAGTDVARFETAGLLIEGAVENLCLQTEDMTTTWVNDQTVVVGSNAATAPDGNMTADTIEDTAGSVFRSMFQTVTISLDDYTCSVYVGDTGATSHAGGISQNATGGTADAGDSTFESEDGTIMDRSGLNPAKDIYSDSISATWWRVANTLDTTDNTSLKYNVLPAVATDASSGWASTITGTQTVWGMNITAGSFPTSYIPATTGAVTRAGDFLSYSAPDVVVDTEGGIYLEFTPLFKSDQPNDAVLVNIADQQVGPLYILDDTTQKIACGDGTTVLSVDPTFVRGTTYKIAVRWNSATAKMQLIVDGTATSEVAYDGAWTRGGVGTLFVGSASASLHVNGNIANTQIYQVDKGTAFWESFTSGAVPEAWLLSGGFWSDIGEWDDSSVWED